MVIYYIEGVESSETLTLHCNLGPLCWLVLEVLISVGYNFPDTVSETKIRPELLSNRVL